MRFRVCKPDKVPASVPPVPGMRVIEAELRQHQFQVLDVHARRETLSAAGAPRALVLLAGRLIELDAELRRPLEDVEELAKGQIRAGPAMTVMAWRMREKSVRGAAQPERAKR